MRIENLGPIKKADINLGKLTVFCGGNNQGKTYVSYALYGLMDSLPHFIRGIFKKEEIIKLLTEQKLEYQKEIFMERVIEMFSISYHKNEERVYKNTFKVDDEQFAKTKIRFSKQEIENLIINPHISAIEMKLTLNTELNMLVKIDETKFSVVLVGNLQNNDIDWEDCQKSLDEVTKRYIIHCFSAFYIPAERIGINVFRTQLNENKLGTLDALASIIQFNDARDRNEKEEFRRDTIRNFFNVLSEVNTSFPEPINDYLKFINAIKNYGENKGEESPPATFIRDNILNGKFGITENTGQSYFRIKYGNKRYKKDYIPLQITSSSLKSMYGLDHYLETLEYFKSNYIIIDEPEMNLHPSNQVEIANLFNLMIKKGLNIIISTHSDFLMKKIQNIVLQNELEEENTGLNKESLKIYQFENGTVKLVDMFDDHSVFENFNGTVELLEDEYLDLLDELAIKEQGKEE
ncbi:AAA family ATPase [Bacillus pacificus]|uniref:AAA family ATPase n=1 Tax=Bacillus pacificus TaxID=2026187 RepID=UPI003D64CA9C